MTYAAPQDPTAPRRNFSVRMPEDLYLEMERASAAETLSMNRFIQLAIDGAYPVLAALFQFFPEPCEANPRGVGSKPRCPEGVAAGGMVQTARVTACERAYLFNEADIEKVLRPAFAFPLELFAVFRTDGSRYLDFVPTGATAIVISDPKREVGRVLYLDADGRLVGMRLGCGETPLQMTSGIASGAFIVRPPAR